MMESVSKFICDVCQKKFCSISSKNRHLKKMHDKKVEKKMSQHIRCPLCPEEKQEALANHDTLINHLTDVHCVSIKQSELSFRNIKEFEVWRSKENKEVDYACGRRKKSSNSDQYVYYNCNRSNSCGFKSNCTKRTMKAGGSIKISGICPSRILVKICENGTVSVKFVETHVGHEDELRTKRLTKEKQTMIVDQLHAGVTNEKILQDARKITVMKEEEMKDFVESVEFDNELCDEDCRRGFCNECKICIRRYNCECPEFNVKTVLCKHIHEVVLYERRMNKSVLNIGSLGEENSEGTSYIQEPTMSKTYQDELCQFLEEKNNEASKSIDSERRQRILVEEIHCFTKSLDMGSLDKFADIYRTFRTNLEREKNNEICKKRKIQKQTYYPNKN